MTAALQGDPRRVGRSPRRRRVVGAAIVLGGAAILLFQQWAHVGVLDPHVEMALRGGMVAALATALGTLPVLVSRSFSERARDASYGFGAGVMLAACAFSLLLPGLTAARDLGFGRGTSGLLVSAGLLTGALALLLLERWLPHDRFIARLNGSDDAARALKRTWLFIFAVTVHNLPEGLAIGVAHAGESPASAAALTTGIAIQDVPEGLVIALALMSAGYRRSVSVLMGAASGLVEPMAAVLGAALVGLSAQLLPWGLAFAAGAMLFVISHEIIPESHRHGHGGVATGALMLGFVLMMTLDTSFG